MKKIINLFKFKDRKLLFLIAIIFLLSISIFQKPYYFVFYDSEPDYLGNALHIANWGFPIAAHHPATLTYYFLAIIIKIIPTQTFTIGNEILFLRLCLLSSCFYLIYSACKSMYNKNEAINIFILALSFSYIAPPINFFVDLISGEIVLFGLGFLVIAEIYNYINGNLQKNFLLPFLLGISLSVKLSSLSLVFIVLACHLHHIYFIYKQGQTKVQFIGKIKSFLTFYFVMIVCFIILSFPVLTHVNDSFVNLFNRLGDDFSYRNIIGGIILIILILCFLIKLSAKIRTIYTTSFFFIILCRFILFTCFLLWVVYFFKVLSTTDELTYASFSIATRHLNPLLSILFLPGIFVKLKIQLPLNIKNFTLFLIIISSITVKILINQAYEKYAEDKEMHFNNILSSISNKADHIMLYPSSEFVSKKMFELWTTYRYGNGMINFGEVFSSAKSESNIFFAIVSFLIINDFFEIKNRSAFDFTKSDTNSLKKRINFNRRLVTKSIPAYKKIWYKRITWDRVQIFLNNPIGQLSNYLRNFSYQSGFFLNRFFGFNELVHVYNYRYQSSIISIPNDSTNIVLVVPSMNIDYLYEGKPKGHYFVARTPKELKEGYINELRFKLQEKNIAFKEHTISSFDRNNFKLFLLSPNK